MWSPPVMKLGLGVLVLASAARVASPQEPAKMAFTEKLLATIPADLKSPKPFRQGDSSRNRSSSPGGAMVLSGIGFGAEGTDWSPRINADGSLLAYRARRGDKEFVVIGDRPGKAYDSVSAPVLSADGRKVAYAATDGKLSYVVIGEEQGPAFGSVSDPVFSRDGARVAYAASEGKKEFVVIDGKRGAEFISVSAPRFSPDGTRVAYVAQASADNAVVMTNETSGPSFNEIRELIFRPDGVLAFVAGDGKKMFFVNGEQRGPEFDIIVAPVFSPDGARLAYVGWTTKGNWTVVVGDSKQAEYTNIGAPVFSPDGTRLAYGALKGSFMKGPESFLVVDGQASSVAKSKQFRLSAPQIPELLPYPYRSRGTADTARSLAFGPDGKSIAYRQREMVAGLLGDHARIVVGGKGGEWFDSVSAPVFSPDGKKVGFLALKGREIWWKVVDVE